MLIYQSVDLFAEEMPIPLLQQTIFIFEKGNEIECYSCGYLDRAAIS